MDRQVLDDGNGDRVVVAVAGKRHRVRVAARRQRPFRARLRPLLGICCADEHVVHVGDRGREARRVPAQGRRVVHLLAQHVGDRPARGVKDGRVERQRPLVDRQVLDDGNGDRVVVAVAGKRHRVRVAARRQRPFRARLHAAARHRWLREHVVHVGDRGREARRVPAQGRRVVHLLAQHVGDRPARGVKDGRVERQRPLVDRQVLDDGNGDRVVVAVAGKRHRVRVAARRQRPFRARLRTACWLPPLLTNT